MVRILLANDDGILATGLQTLAAKLADAGFDVTVIAPDQERSATGHALTLHHPLRVQEVTVAGKVPGYAISGTPSDCIKIGLNAILDFRPDMILSGINHGPNLGSDVLYSGTVSAALEGALNSIPSVAISLFNGYDKNADFSHGADFMAAFVPRIAKAELPVKTILNINIPPVPISDMTGIRMTSLGMRLYTDTYEKRTDPRGRLYYWLAGEVIANSEEAEDTDVVALRDNMISITPVSFDMTHRDVIASHRAMFERPQGTPLADH